MTILQIETATTVCSVALAKDGDVLAFKQVEQRNIHAEAITIFIDELLAETGTHYAAIDAIAVSCGPGSYTGLRIGISTAKGLCYALDKPLIAIETLESMAQGIINDPKALSIFNFQPATLLLCPMIDARRMEVYTAIYNINGENIKPTTAEIIDENSFAELLEDHQILFFGDGAGKCRDVLSHNKNAFFLPEFVTSATHLTKKAAEKFTKKDFEDVAYFEPFYLKDFIAGKKSVQL